MPQCFSLKKKYPNNMCSYKFSRFEAKKNANREEDVQKTGIRAYYCTRMCRSKAINQLNLQILCIFVFSCCCKRRIIRMKIFPFFSEKA